MNEIITRLDEIEKKAESILTDAAAEKENMLKQLEFDKREMDGRYASMKQQQEDTIRKQLLAGAQTQYFAQKKHFEAAEKQLEEEFLQKKDALAKEIFEKIIEP